MKKIRYMIEFGLLFVAQKFVVRLPFRWLRPLASGLGSLAYFFDIRGRKVALANIEAAFGEHYTAPKRKRIARQSYGTFARTMIELLWMPNVTPEFVRKNCRVFYKDKDGKLCEQPYAGPGCSLQDCRAEPPFDLPPNRGVIFICPHFSNFEWFNPLIGYTAKLGVIITAEFGNPYIGPFITSLRTSAGNKVIPRERALMRMFKLLKEGKRFGLLADLNLDVRRGGIAISTFGGLFMAVTPSHVSIAQRTGAALIPMECSPRDDGYYDIIWHTPIECPKAADTAALVQECWNVLEAIICERPHLWLWSYKHWRTKPMTGDTSRYPFYSNIAPYFPNPNA